MKAHDLIGCVFGQLTVIKKSPNAKNDTAWLCRCECGKEKIVCTQNLIRGGTKSCGCLRLRNGKDSAHWKGGTTKHQRGYVLMFQPEHPHCDAHGYVFEHRLVMEQRLGRLLKKEEVVHHINGILNDNRNENLELFSSQAEHIKHHGTINGSNSLCKKVRGKGLSISTVRNRMMRGWSLERALNTMPDLHFKNNINGR